MRAEIVFDDEGDYFLEMGLSIGDVCCLVSYDLLRVYDDVILMSGPYAQEGRPFAFPNEISLEETPEWPIEPPS